MENLIGLWHAENSISNQAMNACAKSFRLKWSSKGTLNASSGAVTVYKSIEKTWPGSVTTAFISTVSTRGSARAVLCRGVKSNP